MTIGMISLNQPLQESEFYTLGCFIKEVSLLEETDLKAQHYLNTKNRIVFESINDMQQKKMEIDLVTIAAYLADTDNLDRIGGYGYLTQIEKHVGRTDNFYYHEKRLIDHFKIVSVKTICQSVIENHDLQIQDVEMIMKDLDKVDQESEAEETSFKDSLAELYMLPFDSEASKKEMGYKTGYGPLDKLTNGFRKKEFIVIGARPSVGKTAFSLNLTLRLAKNDVVIAYFSLEMDKKSLQKRMLCILTGIDGQKTSDPYNMLSAQEKELWTKSLNFFDDKTIEVFEKPKTVSSMRSTLRKLKKKHNGKDIIVMIDYLTKMKAEENHFGNRHGEVTEISHNLKEMAKDFDCPVVCLAQLSRGVETRQDKRPLMSDLRESGSIEQDADVIGFLYREFYQTEKDSSDMQPVEFNITKQRNGAVGTLYFTLNKPNGRFSVGVKPS